MADQTDEQTETETPKTSLVRTLAEHLWFPLFFMTGFLVCYLLPFHSPSPHQVPVAVAGPAAGQVGQALEHAMPGAFDIEQVADGTAAREQVLDRDAIAAFVPDSAHPMLYVTKANGYMLESVLTKAFTPFAAGHPLATTDLAPTAPGDTMGTGLFYLILVWNIPGYIVVMMLQRAVSLSRRAKVLVLLGWGVFASIVAFYVGLAMDVVPNDPAAIGIAFLLVEGIALTAFGLVPIAKQFFPGVAMGLFILLSMPSSGGAIPIQMVPGFFRALHPFMPMGNAIEAMRGLFYFDGVGMTRPMLVLGAWVLLGAALIGGHALWQRHKAKAVEPDGAAEPPIEDPVIEMPEPTAIPAGARGFAGPEPMMVGTVHAHDGHPVPGAAVTVLNHRGRQLVRTTTDHDGRYAVTGLPEDFVDLVASAPGKAPMVRRTVVSEGAPGRQDFVLG
ncbi:carboxypeptidase regulatory-like domain-containing protein [Sciscionella marina]|uniref:carboxypeptidase regulatory-like domain-containing protein n=1 Tax=Sciscionella marina TaxID=508770 RepID=UPI00036742BA|nr:carboxypeptidase regulatory-like domain-containing protein [Sciscionella marina]